MSGFFICQPLILSTMDRFKQLQELVATFETDFHKFYVKENKAAGVRVRKHMQTLRKAAQEIRDEVQSMKKTETPG